MVSDRPSSQGFYFRYVVPPPISSARDLLSLNWVASTTFTGGIPCSHTHITSRDSL